MIKLKFSYNILLILSTRYAFPRSQGNVTLVLIYSVTFYEYQGYACSRKHLAAYRGVFMSILV